MTHFPLEAARLEVAFPLMGLGIATMLGYGWVLEYGNNIVGVFVMLFALAFAATGVFHVVSTLLIDLHSGSAGTASAANNLVRCTLGAGASAAIVPLIDRVGNGWAYSIIGMIWIAFVPLMVITMRMGSR